MKPIVTQDSKTRSFDFVFGLLHPKQFREFAQRVGTNPNLCVPKSVSDKYLWRKVFDHDPQFTVFCDKLAAKDYVASRCPDIPAARVLWQGNDIGQAPAELLKGPGFLKSNHGSGFYLRLDEKPRSLDELRAITAGWLRGWHHTKPRKWKYRGQWGYKNVKRTLFIEEDLRTDSGGPIVDFSVYVFCGKVTDFSVMFDHKTDHIRYARFDSSGRRSDCEPSTAKFSPLARDFELPVNVTKICDSAIKIAGGSDHLRIDLMWNGRELYFGEITVYSHGGFLPMPDKALLAKMAESWDLRRSWFLSNPQTGWRERYAKWLKRTLESADPNSAR
jgi:hypothetical protein